MNATPLPGRILERRRFLERTIRASAAMTVLTASTPTVAEESSDKSLPSMTTAVNPSVNITDTPYNADPTGVSNCASAISSAMAAGTDIIVPPGTYLIATNLTIPNGKVLRVSAGAKFKLAAGITLTVRGLILAPSSVQIFIAQSNTSSGTVTGLRECWPEWWGAKGDGITDDLIALNCAHSSTLNSKPSDGGHPSIYLSHVYAISGPWILAPNATIGLRVIGSGWLNAAIVPTANFPVSPVLRVVGTSGFNNVNWKLSNFRIVAGSGGIGGATAGLMIGNFNPTTFLNGVHDNIVEDIEISGFPSCLIQCEARFVKYERCSFSNETFSAANVPVKIMEFGDFTGDITFSDCQIVGNIDSTTAAISLEAVNGGSIAGIRIRGLVAYKGQNYVLIHAANSSSVLDTWIDGGTQFDSGCTNAVMILSESGGSISDIHIDGVYFTAHTSDAIVLKSATGGGAFGWIQSVFVRNCWIAMGSGRGVYVQDNGSGFIQGVSISNNEIWSVLSTGLPAIEIRSNAVNCIGNFATSWATGRFSYFVQIDAGCNNIVVANNNSGGLATSGAIQDLSGAVTKSVSGNI